MPKICGFVRFNAWRNTTEALMRLVYNKNSNTKKRILFSKNNDSGAFVCLSSEIDSPAPYNIIYKNVKYTYIFDGKLENATEVLNDISKDLGFLPTDEGDHASIAAWAYILWGGSSPCKLDGKFAYAIYSEEIMSCTRHTPRIFIARDKAGIKPIYFTYDNNDTIIFSSDISAILSCKSCGAKLDKQGLWQALYLSGGSIDGQTLFKDVYELACGCCAYIDCRSDGLFCVMQKRYHSILSLDKTTPTEVSFDEIDFIEDNDDFCKDKTIEDLVSSVEITEFPVFQQNFTILRSAKNSSITHFSSIGREVFENQKRYLRSFFPWVNDPYRGIELYNQDVISHIEGFNWLQGLFEKYINYLPSELTEEQKQMTLKYLYLLPNKLKFNERIADHFNVEINYPYAAASVFKYYFQNFERQIHMRTKPNKKISEFNTELKRELQDVMSNSENRINYLIDRRAVDLCDDPDTLEKVYLFHTWLEKFKVTFDF